MGLYSLPMPLDSAQVFDRVFRLFSVEKGGGGMFALAAIPSGLGLLPFDFFTCS